MEFFSHSQVLFVGDDGHPLEFYSHYSGEEKFVIMSMIEYGGGIFYSEKSNSAVCLVDLGDNHFKRDGGTSYISMKFIWDCVEQNVLLDMNNYIISGNENNFTKDEDMTLIKFIIKYSSLPHNNMPLTNFFNILSEKAVLKRDPYSIKSRVKRIYFHLEAYNLSADNERKFKSVIKPALLYGSFTKHDDYAIINFLENRVSKVHLKEVYDEMERKKVVKFPSKSVFYRTLKLILPNIDLYDVSAELKSSIKEHLSQIFRINYESSLEDHSIINYVQANIKHMRSISLYDQMEEKNVLKRSATYMQLRFLYRILPNIDTYNIPAYFKKRFRNAACDGFSIFYEKLDPVVKGKEYCKDHDYVIIHYLQERKGNPRVITAYEGLEKTGLIKHSAQSMKLRFLNHILPNLETYDIPARLKLQFTTECNKKTTQQKNKQRTQISVSEKDPSAMNTELHHASKLPFTSHFENAANPSIPARKGTANATRQPPQKTAPVTHQTPEKSASVTHQAPQISTNVIRQTPQESTNATCQTPQKSTNATRQAPHNSTNAKRQSPLKSKNTTHRENSRFLDSEVPHAGNNLVSSDFEVIVENPSGSARKSTANRTRQTPIKSSNRTQRTPTTSASTSHPSPQKSATQRETTGRRSRTPTSSRICEKKRRKCAPLQDSDSDSASSDRTLPRSPVKTTRRKTNGRTATNSNRSKKPTKEPEAPKVAYAGDIFSYFLTQQSCPEEGDDISAFLSQNSLVTASSSKRPGPSIVENPCFLQSVLDRCQNASDNDDEESVNTVLSSSSKVEEHFPVELKMKFMSQAISLLQDIEYNTLFHECVQDSLFYQKLVFKLYRLNSTVYKNFVEKNVRAILKKPKLSLTDKVFLIKYLSCLEKISPENPMEVFSRCKLR